ncbi:MAG: hypothetical protein ABI867_15105 [Kofleriaceae bacterium]
MRTLCLALFLISCGSDSAERPDASPGIDADIDAADGGGEITCGAAGPAEQVCDGACVDTSTDPDHCGDCTTACTGAQSACSAGACVAPLTSTWVQHFGGGDFGFGVSGVGVDGAGNTYLAARFVGTIDLGGGPLVSAGSTDIVVASFAPNGDHRWSRRFGGAESDQATGVAVVGGKLYVTGSFSAAVDFGGGVRTSAGASDIFVLAVSAQTGAPVFDRTYGGTGEDAGLSIGVDASGNITFGGFFIVDTLDLGGGNTISTLAFAGFVASIDPAGTHRWSRRLGGDMAADISSMQALAVDAAGNVAIAVEFQGTDDFGAGPTTSAGQFDALIASYTSAGTLRWARRFGAGQSDTPAAISVDGSGNVLTGGGFHSTVDFGVASLTSSGVVDGWVALLEAATGTTRWVRKIGAASRSGVNAVAFGADGNAIISVAADGATNLGTGPLTLFDKDDIVLAGMQSSTGTTQFANVYGGDDFEGASTLAVTRGGGLVLGGYFRTTVNFGLASGPIAGGPKDNGFVMMIAH